MGRPLSEAISEIAFDELDGAFEWPRSHADWIKYNLKNIDVCFSAGDQNNRMLLAGQWLFDSYIGHNELLSFVQTMIALEILLEDK
jgi:hypothetical protein